MKYTDAKILLGENGLMKKVPGTEDFIVQSAFSWYIDYKDKRYKIEVQKLFKTNFGSIPRPMRMVMDKTKYVAYILHDWIWSPEGKIIDVETGKEFEIGFKESNEILMEAMRVEGSSNLESRLVYIGLQYTIFPYFHFENCKNEKK